MSWGKLMVCLDRLRGVAQLSLSWLVSDIHRSKGLHYPASANIWPDNLGNVVQEVNGLSTIVGDYLQNMVRLCDGRTSTHAYPLQTYTGESQNLGNGMTKKTYSYSPLNALVDIVFNSAGQIVQAVTQKKNGNSSSSSTSSATASAATTSGTGA